MKFYTPVFETAENAYFVRGPYQDLDKDDLKFATHAECEKWVAKRNREKYEDNDLGRNIYK
jgi:hypothetical protein